MKHIHNELRPSSILSPTRIIGGVAKMTKLLAKCDAELILLLLAEAEGLPPQQAPPGSNPVLIPGIGITQKAFAGVAHDNHHNRKAQLSPRKSIFKYSYNYTH